MYKIKFEENVENILEKENIEELKLISLIQEDILNREMDEISDIIFTLKLGEKNIALIGKINKKTISFFHISTNPIIVDNK